VVLWISLLACLVVGVIAGVVSLIRGRNRR
jgi:hypothetical protein